MIASASPFEIIRRKPFLRRLYRDFYEELKAALPPMSGKIIEIGSGGGFIKEVIPEAVTSDVNPGPEIDHVFSALAVPYPNASVAAFVMLNVFHHISDPERALREFERCLIPGGKVIMIEPYNSTWGRFIYQHWHHEPFDPTAAWELGSREANGALPWIIFVRDRQRFRHTFPRLTLQRVRPHTPLSYLISGGLTWPQLLPAGLWPLVGVVEKWLALLSLSLGMFVTIELKKNEH